jgi:cytochrome P450
MVQHLDVQTKAQAEIDAVVGRSQLVSFSDRKNLPYVNAIVKEVIRWRPALPLGVPHRATVDDVYNGMLIPKGALVFANSWFDRFRSSL